MQESSSEIFKTSRQVINPSRLPSVSCLSASMARAIGVRSTASGVAEAEGPLSSRVFAARHGLLLRQK